MEELQIMEHRREAQRAEEQRRIEEAAMYRKRMEDQRRFDSYEDPRR